MTDANTSSVQPANYREQLKNLRAVRGPISPAMLERQKANNRAERAVLKAISGGAKTVPEIAVETGLTAQQAFWWIAALRKYNMAREEKKRGEYMAYIKTGDAPAEEGES